MATEVAIPDIGESINEVILREWLKAEGDYVEKDEPICVLETDKANVDLPAPAAGVLQLLRKVGETVAVGEALARIEAGGRPAAVRSTPSLEDEALQSTSPLCVSTSRTDMPTRAGKVTTSGTTWLVCVVL